MSGDEKYPPCSSPDWIRLQRTLIEIGIRPYTCQIAPPRREKASHRVSNGTPPEAVGMPRTRGWQMPRRRAGRTETPHTRDKLTVMLRRRGRSRKCRTQRRTEPPRTDIRICSRTEGNRRPAQRRVKTTPHRRKAPGSAPQTRTATTGSIPQRPVTGNALHRGSPRSLPVRTGNYPRSTTLSGSVLRPESPRSNRHLQPGSVHFPTARQTAFPLNPLT